MKKLYFLMTSATTAAVMTAIVAILTLSSCNDGTPVDPDLGDDSWKTGVPAPGTRLVDKLSYSLNDHDITLTFHYDSRNRIVRVDDADDDSYFYALSYGENSVTLRRTCYDTEVEGDRLVVTTTYDLAPDGSVVGWSNPVEEYYLNDKPHPYFDEPSIEKHTLTYQYGRLTAMTNEFQDSSEVGGVRVEATGITTDSYSWTDNLTRVAREKSYTDITEGYEPSGGMTSETEMVIEYSDNVNRADVNIDFNMYVSPLTGYTLGGMPNIFALGFGGVRSANLLDRLGEIEGESIVRYMDMAWKTDADGYVTGFTVEHNIWNTGAVSFTVSYR
jgi:hypothetical protein